MGKTRIGLWSNVLASDIFEKLVSEENLQKILVSNEENEIIDDTNSGVNDDSQSIRKKRALKNHLLHKKKTALEDHLFSKN